MRRNIILLSLILLVIPSILFGQGFKQKAISKALLLEDYDYMLKTLEDTHPNLYAYIPSKEFRKKTDELRKLIDKSLTKTEFFKILLRTIALVQQDHTMVFGDAGFGAFLKSGGLAFPFKVKYDSDHIYINENYSSNTDITKGSELIAINRVPVSKIIDDFTPYLRIRPNGFKGGTIEYNWMRYLWMEYGFDKEFTLSYILPGEDVIRTNTVEGVSIAHINQKKIKKNNEPFIFNIDKDKSIAVMKINTFQFDFDVFDAHLKKSFKSIKENKIENLIIDMRDNGGGNANLVKTLVDYLSSKPYVEVAFSQVKSSKAAKKCYTTHPIFINAIEQARKAEGESSSFAKLIDDFFKSKDGTVTSFSKEEIIPSKNKYRFSGQLYVLSSHQTFSAATGFCVTVKDNKLGYIVGEETLDNPTDYGCIMLFPLPNTKINIQNSIQYTVRPAGYDDKHGVLPDFRIKESYSDFLNGTDKVMNYTYWLINEKIKL